MGNLQPTRLTDGAGTVALASCESPLLERDGCNILLKAEIVGILMAAAVAAAAAYHRATTEGDRAEPRAAVAALIDGNLLDGTLAGGNFGPRR